MPEPVPDERVRVLRDGKVGRGPVVYWCTRYRRVRANPALQYAVEQANASDLGMWVLETLRPDRPYASARSHHWVLDGMRDTRAALQKAGIPYCPVAADAQQAQAAVTAAVEHAGLVVVDDHPYDPPVLPNGTRGPAPVHAVDGNGLIPLAMAGKAFTTAAAFRRYWHGRLLDHLWLPAPDLPDVAAAELPQIQATDLDSVEVDQLPVDHEVAPVDATGGEEAGRARLDAWLPQRLDYLDARHPDKEATSGISPYLRHGQLDAADVARAVLEAEDWTPASVNPGVAGRRQGWWGVSEPAEAFLDQLVTWRTLGFVHRRHVPDDHAYATLPDWAKATLSAHEADRRPGPTPEQLERAESGDPVWDAAQRQLLRDGVIHNYLRMVWGKRLLEWAPDAKTALAWMFHLNDRWALDGRDPNSISGITWCLGRFDRAWGPERPVFGKVRYMSSENTLRKLRMKDYLNRYGA